jgi:hypothetical protein
MHTSEIRHLLNMIEDYWEYSNTEEAYPERWCMIQQMIYEGDYGLRCGMCKFSCRWGLKLGQCGCDRPWTCN